jgi:hypothetical protein
VLCRFEKPFLVCFSDRDPITKGGDAPLRAKVPGAAGQAPTTVEGAGHVPPGDLVGAALGHVVGRADDQRSRLTARRVRRRRLLLTSGAHPTGLMYSHGPRR